MVIWCFDPLHNDQWPPTSKDFYPSNKGTRGTIFITSLEWRGLWLGIEPGTSRTRSQHSTTRLSRRRSLTGDWTRDLDARTLPLGYRGGGPWLGIEPGSSRTRSPHSTTRLSRRRYRLQDPPVKYMKPFDLLHRNVITFFILRSWQTEKYRKWWTQMFTACSQVRNIFRYLQLIVLPSLLSLVYKASVGGRATTCTPIFLLQSVFKTTIYASIRISKDFQSFWSI